MKPSEPKVGCWYKPNWLPDSVSAVVNRVTEERVQVHYNTGHYRWYGRDVFVANFTHEEDEDCCEGESQ